MVRRNVVPEPSLVLRNIVRRRVAALVSGRLGRCVAEKLVNYIATPLRRVIHGVTTV
jgi:hypothetical protein